MKAVTYMMVCAAIVILIRVKVVVKKWLVDIGTKQVTLAVWETGPEQSVVWVMTQVKLVAKEYLECIGIVLKQSAVVVTVIGLEHLVIIVGNKNVIC